MLSRQSNPVAVNEKNIVNHELANLLQKIHFSCKVNNLKTIGIYSELPGEGKSHVLIGLAYFLSKIYHEKILIADCKLFGDPLLDRIKTTNPQHNEKIVKETVYKNVQILNISSLSRSSEDDKEVLFYRLSKVLEALKDEYSLILINSSSPTSAEDRSNLLVVTDGAIMVKTKKSLGGNKSTRVEDMLRDHQINLMGMIFNKKG